MKKPHPSKILFILGSLFLLISLVGTIHEIKKFFQGYLFSFLFWSDLPLGAIPMIMIYHLTGGNWGNVSRKILEALSDTLLLIAVLCLPILGGLHQIYPWLDPQIALDPKIQHKLIYLNLISFSIRTVIYFGCWLWMNHFLQHYAATREEKEDPESKSKLRSLSAGGLVLFGFISTFASVDWQMSVEPTWYSTIYGMVYVTGQALSAYSFSLLIFGLLNRSKDTLSRFSKKTLRDLGNILLTLIMTWTYLAFMQYLIIWSGNLPHEVIWFKHRSQGGWQWLALILFLFQFSAPFILLLFRASKDDPRRLAWIGGLVFSIRLIDHYWMLLPGFRPQRFEISWQIIAIWLGIGGIWLSVFLKRLQTPLSPPSRHVFSQGVSS